MQRIDENHQMEQYFFDRPTVEMLADAVAAATNPCCLCVPMVARELQARGRTVALLEADQRFSDLPGFVAYDLYRPQPIATGFDLILCDPPFNRVLLSQLFQAIRVLAKGSFAQPLMIAWPVEREAALLGTFAPFGLVPTGVIAGYRSVKKIPKNQIALYANTGWTGPNKT
ncbi:MAG: hypothetical protein ACPG4T_12590 [Nannocystaceae bacterium]